MRINFTQHWKKDSILTISDWELNLGEYATMAKLTVHIHNRRLSKFKQEQFPYTEYIMQLGQCKWL